MQQTRYRSSIPRRSPYQKPSRRRGFLFWTIIVLLVVAVGLGIYAYFKPTPEKAADKLQFDATVAGAEKESIRQAIVSQSKTYSGSVSAGAETVLENVDPTTAVAVYVPVTNKYAVRQAVTTAELGGIETFVPTGTDEVVRTALATALGTEVKSQTKPIEEVTSDAVVFIPADQLSPNVKLLAFEGAYYLDTFQKGAVFRKITFTGGGSEGLAGLKLNDYTNKDTTLKVNQTGVTALTRRMMTKLDQVKDPAYFSKNIGAFLADADITHVSNEVSFKPGCEYNNAVFCSPPQFIETLKASGVDLVELTGNHNNDVGRQYNTDTINQYRTLGWGTVGGGLNTADAAKPFIAEQKGSKIAILAYNYPDSPNGGAIATASAAGANSFEVDRIESDIAAAKEQGATTVIVDIQFWECYAYPEGYSEYPICDQPIPNQKQVFRQMIDLGADMVVGTSAHQPQTFEFYKDKAIYYGLGNLYFDQTQWPGTERGIILTHYFAGGKLLQTKLSPTVYHKELQTRLMDAEETTYQLERLNTARENAGL